MRRYNRRWWMMVEDDDGQYVDYVDHAELMETVRSENSNLWNRVAQQRGEIVELNLEIVALGDTIDKLNTDIIDARRKRDLLWGLVAVVIIGSIGLVSGYLITNY